MSENLKDNIQWLRDTIDLTENQRKLVDYLDNMANVNDHNYYKLLNLVELLEPVLQDADKLLRHQVSCESIKYAKLSQHLKVVLNRIHTLSSGDVIGLPDTGK